jgi:hypothetical protein
MLPSVALVVCATAAALSRGSLSNAHTTLAAGPLAVADCGQAGGSSVVTCVQSHNPLAVVSIARSRQSVGYPAGVLSLFFAGGCGWGFGSMRCAGVVGRAGNAGGFEGVVTVVGERAVTWVA